MTSTLDDCYEQNNSVQKRDLNETSREKLQLPISSIKQKQKLLSGGCYKNIVVINQCDLMNDKQESMEQKAGIVQIFKGAPNNIKKHLKKLEQESSINLGSTYFLFYKKEWIQLSSKLSKFNNSRKLCKCLQDRNHRRLMIQFVKHRAVELYNLSYFNGAKISDHYISFLCSSNPYIFTEILVIVNKLKLIQKHFSNKFQNKRYGENHIDLKIIKILEMCQNDRKKLNMNIDKFIAITQFEEDRYELILELGKMLRKAWILEKQEMNKKTLHSQPSQVSSQPFFHSQNEFEEIDRGQVLEISERSMNMGVKMHFKDLVGTTNLI